MDIRIIKVGALEENCYIVGNDKVLLIDPGDEVDKIIKYLEDNKLSLEGILITHHHFDHVGALNDLLEYKNAKVYEMDEGIYNILDFNIEVINTPGHTNDSKTYYFKDYNIMFTGDFIFKDSIGRCDLGGNIFDMKQSLNKIKKYPKDILVYPGHGGSTILGIEFNNYYFNEFLN